MKRSVALARRYMQVQAEAFEELHPSGKLHPLVCLVAGSLGAYGASFLGTLKISFSATHSSHCWFVGSRHFILIDRKRTHTNP